MPFETYERTRSKRTSRVRFAGLAGREQGDGHPGARPVVFLHGLTFDRHMWDPILDALPSRHHAVALDLPGHGASRALASHGLPAVVEAIHEAVLDAGLDRPLVVGHSIGAVLASMYAVTHDAAGVVNVDAQLPVEAFARLAKTLEPQMRNGGFDRTWEMYRESMHMELVPDDLRGLLAPGLEVRADLVLGYWSDLFEMSVEELVAWVDDDLATARLRKLPYLALYGDPVDPDELRWLDERLPQAEISVWPVGHHFPHLAEPAGFAALVSAFAADIA